MFETMDHRNIVNLPAQLEPDEQTSEVSKIPDRESMGSILVRLSHVESYDYPIDERLPVHMLAERIGTNRQWVHRMVRDYGIEPEDDQYQGRTIACYPSFTLPLLLDEYQWRNDLRSLPPLLTVTELAEHIGRSWVWTNNALAELSARPVTSVKRSSSPSDLYNKNILNKLRRISMAFPMESGWHNMRQLELITGENREWIARRLSDLGICVEIRRSALTGKLYEYYPPEAVDLIKGARLAHPEVANIGWLTAEAVPSVVGRSYNWCKSRLVHFELFAEFRQDSQGASRLHYPPWVISVLSAEKESIEEYPEADDMITFSTAALEIGRSKTWVRKQIVRLGIEGVERRDKKGRVREHYPRNIVQQIIFETKSSQDS